MKQDAKSQILRNIIWGLITALLSLGISFFMTPYITKVLGIEAYGYISLSNTLITYIDIIAVAVNAFASRYIALAYHNGDLNKAGSYYNSALAANIIFTLAVGLSSIIIVWKLQNIIYIPVYLMNDVKILFACTIVNYSLNLFAAFFSIAAFLKNYVSITSRNKGITAIIYAAIILAFLGRGCFRVYDIVIANIIAAVLLLLLNMHYSKIFVPELKASPKNYSLEHIKHLISSGIWNSINNLGNLLNSGLDLLVANNLLSPLIMGKISVSKQLAAIITNISFLVSNAFQSKQLEAYAKGEIARLIDYLVIAMKCMGLLAAVVFTCFIVVGKQFLGLWIPDQDINMIYSLTVIVLAGDVITVVVRPLFYVNTLTDKLRVVCWITVISGILNLMGMIVLIKQFYMEAYAVVLTTMVLNIIVHLIITPFMAARFLQLEDRFIFSRVVIRYLYMGIVGLITGMLLGRFLSRKLSWLYFVVNGFVVSVLAGGVMFCGEFTHQERQTVYKIIRRR